MLQLCVLLVGPWRIEERPKSNNYSLTPSPSPPKQNKNKRKGKAKLEKTTKKNAHAKPSITLHSLFSFLSPLFSYYPWLPHQRPHIHLCRLLSRKIPTNFTLRRKPQLSSSVGCQLVFSSVLQQLCHREWNFDAARSHRIRLISLPGRFEDFRLLEMCRKRG